MCRVTDASLHLRVTLQMLAAVDLDLFAGDVARRRRAEEEHDLRDFLRRPDALHRDAGCKPPFGF